MAQQGYLGPSTLSGGQMNILLMEFRNVYEDKLDTLKQAEVLGQDVNAVRFNSIPIRNVMLYLGMVSQHYHDIFTGFIVVVSYLKS